MKFFIALTSLFFVSGVLSQATCPLKCPACTKCDPKKGTCTVARDFVLCTRNAVPGVCFAGTCNTKISLPGAATSNKCQTYSCPASGTCTLITAPDGSDCTPLNVAYESVCLQGTCQRIWLGVTDAMPYQNTGCVGKPDNALCDTNHVFTDGERCVGGVCRFPDGNFYGYVAAPPVVLPPPA
jgi:hypothetical protein